MGDVIDSSRFGGKVNAATGSGGGGMDDILKRLGTLESSVSDIRSQVSGLTGAMPHIATKADVNEVETTIHKVESTMVRWMVGTILAAAALAFAIAKFVHT